MHTNRQVLSILQAETLEVAADVQRVEQKRMCNRYIYLKVMAEFDERDNSRNKKTADISLHESEIIQ